MICGVNSETPDANWARHLDFGVFKDKPQAEDGIRDRSPSRGLGDVYKRQVLCQGDFGVVGPCFLQR